MKKADIVEMYTRFEAQRPVPKGELNHVNDYTLLVAVVLSAQATDVGVNKATKALFARVTTPEQMVALGEAGLKEHIRTIGLYNAKAKNVIALSHILIEKHGSRVPEDRAVLETLPGVGRKTANQASSATSRSASRPSRSTPTSSGSATAPASPPARRHWPSN